MKIKNNRRQNNISLDMSEYELEDIKRLLTAEKAFYLDDRYLSDIGKWLSSDVNQWLELYYSKTNTPELRINCSDLTELKIVLKDGYFKTIAIGLDGETYYVKL